ncbi:MAG: T9SS type A sorting domain-containing protein [Flavobacteriales bacterium]|nr:T9SS type A sorting domain-containing protein [Flavobacteriales bacterium]
MNKVMPILLMPLFFMFSETVHGQCNFLNGDFETWQVDTLPTSFNDTIYYENPAPWISFADQFAALFSSASSFVPKVNKTTDKNSGTYAVRLDANPGQSSDLESFGFCNIRPDQFTGFFKTTGTANDTFLVNVFLINEDPMNFLLNGDTSTAIGKGTFIYIGNQPTYQQFAINIKYKSAAPADTFVVQIANINSNGASPAVSAYIDDVSLFLTNGVEDEEKTLGFQLFPNPTNGYFTVNLNEMAGSGPVPITIINAMGQVVEEQFVVNQNRIDFKLKQPPGIYFVNVVSKENRYTRKIVITD